MSADYRFTIVRKADKKPIATFYYNQVKNINDVTCNGIDPSFENISCNEECPTVIQVSQLESSKKAIEAKMQSLRQTAIEKKLLSAHASSAEVKRDFEEDISFIEDEVNALKWAWSAYDGLLAVIGCLVEDLVISSDGSRDHLAYIENAKGLEGKDSIWTSDVELNVLCCC